MRPLGFVLVAAMLGLAGRAVASGTNPDSPGCVVAAPPASVGLSLVRAKPIDPRLTELTLHSQAMQADTHANVLLPEGYGSASHARYPVLYLLHGAFGSYADWAAHGVEGLVGDRHLIVVMPDDGVDGSYSDWYGTLAGSTGPPPKWESYHIRELVAFIDARYRTTAERSGRFIAGLSSGGGGSTKYAAANPGLFGAVGAFSGADDTDVDYPQYPAISEVLWGITDIPTLGPDGHCTWGDPVTQHVVWLDNDPTYEAQNLLGTPLFLAWGNGDAGP
ncbi:MAG TPA: alpha/beta hydrolase-fold protein, partial [Acidimicrobiales bacterium]|nr:alpha/beta hydrolase-fold protein [Acidimicrobiales bacterium]